MQNVSHISTNICIQFVYKIKRTMTAKICIQNVDINIRIQKLYIIRICIKSVYKSCTNCIRNRVWSCVHFNMHLKKILGVLLLRILNITTAHPVFALCFVLKNLNNSNDLWYIRWNNFSFIPLTFSKQEMRQTFHKLWWSTTWWRMEFPLETVEGTLMQIWKSPYIFVLI